MAAAGEISCIDEVFSDAPSMNETRLVRINKNRDSRVQPVDRNFGEELHGAILEGNRPESIGSTSPFFLRFFTIHNTICTIGSKRTRM